jgi:hypothetical protein
MFVIALWYWRKECADRWRRWIVYGWRWFWVVNAILLVGALTHYGQRGKIEPLIGLFEQENVTGVIVDLSERGRRTDLPLFYADGGGVKSFPTLFQTTTEAERDSLLESPDGRQWSHIIVFARSDSIASVMPEKLDQQIDVLRHTGPTLVEQALLKLNPKYTHSRESWLLRIKRP